MTVSVMVAQNGAPGQPRRSPNEHRADEPGGQRDGWIFSETPDESGAAVKRDGDRIVGVSGYRVAAVGVRLVIVSGFFQGCFQVLGIGVLHFHRNAVLGTKSNDRVITGVYHVHLADVEFRTLEHQHVADAEVLDGVRTVAGMEDEGIGALAAPQTVVAGAAVEEIVVLAPVQTVVAGAAVEEIVLLAAVQRVVAGAAMEGVLAAATGKNIVAVAAIELIAAPAAVQRVVAVAGGAIELIGALAAPQTVIATAAGESIVARGSGDGLIGIGVGCQPRRDRRSRL